MKTAIITDKGVHFTGMVDATMPPALADGLEPNFYMSYACVVYATVMGNISAGDCRVGGLPEWRTSQKAAQKAEGGK